MIKGLACALVVMTAAELAACQASTSRPPQPASRTAAIAREPAKPSGCTVITISKGEEVFFGGNDDYVNPDSYFWVDPGDAEHYGAIWIGQPDNVQQGVNREGLAYDANGLPRVDVNPHPERIPVSGGYTTYPIQILQDCATVEEVMAWVRSHQWHSYMHDQMHFADARGNAVIISAGTDRELSFKHKPAGEGFLTSTNFNVADPSNGFGYPCWRYDRTQELLGQLLNKEDKLTPQDIANVLEAVHQEGGGSWTISSLVADLPNGLVYLYYFYQYDRPVVLDVEEEIANPRAPGPLSNLFPDEVQQEADRRYQQIQAKARRCRLLGILWPVVVLVCLILALSPAGGGRRGMTLWIPALCLLGPLALLAWFLVRRGRTSSTWRAALAEVVGDVMPTVIAFVVILVVFIQVPGTQHSWGLPALILGLPLIMGWLVFQVPLMAPVVGKGYSRFVLRRLFHTLVVANLGMAGINVVAMPLVSRSMRICSILPLSAWTVVIWWAIVVLGTLVGGLMVFIYECWAVRSGFKAWSVLAWGEGALRTPAWSEVWWGVLLSYGALLGGIAIGVILG